MREELDYTVCLDYFKKDNYIEITPWGRKINHFKLVIKGSEQTPYRDGKFVFEIKLSDNYPFDPPYVHCITQIWHPNIDSTIPRGKLNISEIVLINPDYVYKINANTGESGWTPSKTLKDVVYVLKEMIHLKTPSFKPGCALNHEAGEQYLKNREKFNEKARLWTSKYAMN